MKCNIQTIEDIVGADNMSIHDETRQLYSRDIAALPNIAYQIIDNEFKLIVQPQTVRSMVNLIDHCKCHRIPIVPRGNGTSGWGGVLPTHGGVCISMMHLSNFVHIDEYNLLVTVESGMTWKQLLVFLEKIGMTLPVYPSSASAATIGGFVASGGIGIGSAKYGDIRKQVAGLEAILPNGMLTRLGNFILREPDGLEEMAEKGNEYLNQCLEGIEEAQRPDPMDIFLGLFGTFGLITRVTLQVIPKLVLRPVVCIFDSIEDLAGGIARIQNETNPYYMRFITDSYTTKRFSPRSSIDEYGKFILTLAYLDTFYQIDEYLEALKRIVKDIGGAMTGDKRAKYHWDERLYPLRIKTLGPSLVPAEGLIDLTKLPALYNKVVKSIGIESIAIEGTVGTEGMTSFLVWILDDERRKLRYTLGWHRSFDVASAAARMGGKPYAVALWNVPFAEDFYGKERKKVLQNLKRKLDPENIMNPMKVFGGRVSPKKESLSFGFIAGYVVVLVAQALLLFIPPLNFIGQFLWSTSILFPIPLIIAILGGIVGAGFIRLMTIEQALRVGIPMLRTAKKLLRL